jgi:5'(3')-deoxyribonucleotidase
MYSNLPKIKYIYLDLDGVMVNFMKGLSKLGYTIDELNHTPNKVWPKIYMEGSYFWKNLELMPGAALLYKACVEKVGSSNVAFLTAVPHTDASVVGKKAWCKLNFPTAKVFCVKRIEKKEFANENTLLIDDFSKNTNAFIKAGGQAIKFYTSHLAIKELNKLCY